MNPFKRKKEEELLFEKVIDLLQTSIAFYNKEIDSFEIGMEDELRTLLQNDPEKLYRVIRITRDYFEEKEHVAFQIEDQTTFTFEAFPTFYHVYMYTCMKVTHQYESYAQLLEIIEKQGE